MRSITMTSVAHQSQNTSGTCSRSEPRKLRRSWLRELGDHLARLQASAVGPHGIDHRGGGLEERQVAVDHPADAGPQDLDGGLASVGQHREVHLRHRRARDGFALEILEDLVHRPTVDPRERRQHLVGGKRRHLVLQLRQLVGDVDRDQVATGGEHLAELHEDGTQRFERESQALAARAVEPAPEEDAADDRAQPADAAVREHELVEPEPHADGHDLRESQQRQHDGAGAARGVSRGRVPGARRVEGAARRRHGWRRRRSSRRRSPPAAG